MSAVQTIQEGMVIAFRYELREQNNDVIIDSNMQQEPLEFITGRSQIIAGLEQELLNLAIGDSKEIAVAAQDAYGNYDEENIEQVPKVQFEGIDLSIGLNLYAKTEDGRSIPAVVKAFDDEVVTMDYNHPLAGKNLVFKVNVTNIREASSEEKTAGQVIKQGGGGCGKGTCGCKG